MKRVRAAGVVAFDETRVTALAPHGSLIVSDAGNHASLIDGCRLARKTARDVYKHSDMGELEGRLAAHADKDVRWVITDGVFSME